MRTVKIIISVILIGIFFALIRETEKGSGIITEVYYLVGTVCYVGLLVILSTKTNFFKLSKNKTQKMETIRSESWTEFKSLVDFDSQPSGYRVFKVTIFDGNTGKKCGIS